MASTAAGLAAPLALRLEVLSQRMGRGPVPPELRAERSVPVEPLPTAAAPSNPRDPATLPPPLPAHVVQAYAMAPTEQYRALTLNVNSHTNLPLVDAFPAQLACYQETRHTASTAARLVASHMTNKRLCIPGASKQVYRTKRTRKPNPDMGEHGGVLSITSKDRRALEIGRAHV